MKKTILFALLASSTATLAFVGCSSTNSSTAGDGGADSSMTEDSTAGDSGTPTDSGNPSETSTGDTGTDGATPPPAPPTLGAQIDRMGRPAINTALNHTFDPTCVNSSSSGPCAAKDAYNADSNPANWSVPPNPDGGAVPGYFAQFFGNLGIYDALDGVCGNQAGFGYMGTPAYSAMATVLSQDALWLNTSASTCQGYLSVELSALGGVGNTDCGGRAPTYNTIDVTYNLLAGTYIPPGSDAGNYPGPVTNGITAPSKAPTTTFPYFATPH